MTGYGRVSLEHAEVTGARIHMRSSSKGDAPACFELLHEEPRITDWILWDGPEELVEVERMLDPWKKERKTETAYYFSIVERASDEWAGCLGLKHAMEKPMAMIWYFAGVPYHGRGLTSEAVRLAVELAFRELEVMLVLAKVFVGNDASIRILEKVGMRLDEGRESIYEKKGEELTAQSYSISRVDWELGAPPKSDWKVRSTRED